MKCTGAGFKTCCSPLLVNCTVTSWTLVFYSPAVESRASRTSPMFLWRLLLHPSPLLSVMATFPWAPSPSSVQAVISSPPKLWAHYCVSLETWLRLQSIAISSRVWGEVSAQCHIRFWGICWCVTFAWWRSTAVNIWMMLQDVVWKWTFWCRFINNYFVLTSSTARPPPLDLRGLSTITECPTHLPLRLTESWWEIMHHVMKRPD